MSGYIATMESLTATGSATLTNKTISYTNNTITTGYQITQTLPSDPLTTTSVSYVMMGLAIPFTPQNTGKVKISVSGVVFNGTINDGGVVRIYYGTGTAPVNGAAVTGTKVGKEVAFFDAIAGAGMPYAAIGYVTGLVKNVAIWVDLAMVIQTGGNVGVADIALIIEEVIN